MSMTAESLCPPSQVSLSSSSKKTTTTTSAIEALQALGMTSSTACRLASTYGESRCLAVVEYTKRQARTNPSGFAWRALVQQWVLPEAVLSAKVEVTVMERRNAWREQAQARENLYQQIAENRKNGDEAFAKWQASRRRKDETRV